MYTPRDTIREIWNELEVLSETPIYDNNRSRISILLRVPLSPPEIPRVSTILILRSKFRSSK